VQDKLKAPHEELDGGVKPKAGYTVEKAVADWLANGTQRAVGQDRDHEQAYSPAGPRAHR
jgi:hypothetical protein